MLGASISDPNAIESKRKVIQGLRLLPIKTRLEPEKILKQTDAIEIETGIKVRGYQIHHGCTKGQGFFNPMFRILNENRLDGAFINHGRIWGTYLHGIFDNDIFRRRLLNRTRKKNGLNNMPTTKTGLNLEIEFDKLADLVRKNLDIDLLYRILNRDL